MFIGHQVPAVFCTGSDEQVLQIASSPGEDLLAVLHKGSISLYQSGSQRILVGFVQRSESDMIIAGDNQSLTWEGNGLFLAVVTVNGFVDQYTVEKEDKEDNALFFTYSSQTPTQSPISVLNFQTNNQNAQSSITNCKMEFRAYPYKISAVARVKIPYASCISVAGDFGFIVGHSCYPGFTFVLWGSQSPSLFIDISYAHSPFIIEIDQKKDQKQINSNTFNRIGIRYVITCTSLNALAYITTQGRAFILPMREVIQCQPLPIQPISPMFPRCAKADLQVLALPLLTKEEITEIQNAQKNEQINQQEIFDSIYTFINSGTHNTLSFCAPLLNAAVGTTSGEVLIFQVPEWARSLSWISGISNKELSENNSQRIQSSQLLIYLINFYNDNLLAWIPHHNSTIQSPDDLSNFTSFKKHLQIESTKDNLSNKIEQQQQSFNQGFFLPTEGVSILSYSFTPADEAKIIFPLTQPLLIPSFSIWPYQSLQKNDNNKNKENFNFFLTASSTLIPIGISISSTSSVTTPSASVAALYSSMPSPASSAIALAIGYVGHCGSRGLEVWVADGSSRILQTLDNNQLTRYINDSSSTTTSTTSQLPDSDIDTSSNQQYSPLPSPQLSSSNICLSPAPSPTIQQPNEQEYNQQTDNIILSKTDIISIAWTERSRSIIVSIDCRGYSTHSFTITKQSELVNNQSYSLQTQTQSSINPIQLLNGCIIEIKGMYGVSSSSSSSSSSLSISRDCIVLYDSTNLYIATSERFGILRGKEKKNKEENKLNINQKKKNYQIPLTPRGTVDPIHYSSLRFINNNQSSSSHSSFASFSSSPSLLAYPPSSLLESLTVPDEILLLMQSTIHGVSPSPSGRCIAIAGACGLALFSVPPFSQYTSHSLNDVVIFGGSQGKDGIRKIDLETLNLQKPGSSSFPLQQSKVNYTHPPPNFVPPSPTAAELREGRWFWLTELKDKSIVSVEWLGERVLLIITRPGIDIQKIEKKKLNILQFIQKQVSVTQHLIDAYVESSEKHKYKSKLEFPSLPIDRFGVKQNIGASSFDQHSLNIFYLPSVIRRSSFVNQGIQKLPIADQFQDQQQSEQENRIQLNLDKKLQELQTKEKKQEEVKFESEISKNKIVDGIKDTKQTQLNSSQSQTVVSLQASSAHVYQSLDTQPELLVLLHPVPETASSFAPCCHVITCNSAQHFYTCYPDRTIQQFSLNISGSGVLGADDVSIDLKQTTPAPIIKRFGTQTLQHALKLRKTLAEKEISIYERREMEEKQKKEKESMNDQKKTYEIDNPIRKQTSIIKNQFAKFDPKAFKEMMKTAQQSTQEVLSSPFTDHKSEKQPNKGHNIPKPINISEFPMHRAFPLISFIPLDPANTPVSVRKKEQMNENRIDTGEEEITMTELKFPHIFLLYRADKSLWLSDIQNGEEIIISEGVSRYIMRGIQLWVILTNGSIRLYMIRTNVWDEWVNQNYEGSQFASINNPILKYTSRCFIEDSHSFAPGFLNGQIPFNILFDHVHLGIIEWESKLGGQQYKQQNNKEGIINSKMQLANMSPLSLMNHTLSFSLRSLSLIHVLIEHALAFSSPSPSFDDRVNIAVSICEDIQRTNGDEDSIARERVLYNALRNTLQQDNISSSYSIYYPSSYQYISPLLPPSDTIRQFSLEDVLYFLCRYRDWPSIVVSVARKSGESKIWGQLFKSAIRAQWKEKKRLRKKEDLKLINIEEEKKEKLNEIEELKEEQNQKEQIEIKAGVETEELMVSDLKSVLSNVKQTGKKEKSKIYRQQKRVIQMSEVESVVQVMGECIKIGDIDSAIICLRIIESVEKDEFNNSRTQQTQSSSLSSDFISYTSCQAALRLAKICYTQSYSQYKKNKQKDKNIRSNLELQNCVNLFKYGLQHLQIFDKQNDIKTQNQYNNHEKEDQYLIQLWEEGYQLVLKEINQIKTTDNNINLEKQFQRDQILKFAFISFSSICESLLSDGQLRILARLCIAAKFPLGKYLILLTNEQLQNKEKQTTVQQKNIEKEQEQIELKEDIIDKEINLEKKDENKEEEPQLLKDDQELIQQDNLSNELDIKNNNIEKKKEDQITPLIPSYQLDQKVSPQSENIQFNKVTIGMAILQIVKLFGVRLRGDGTQDKRINDDKNNTNEEDNERSIWIRGLFGAEEKYQKKKEGKKAKQAQNMNILTPPSSNQNNKLHDLVADQDTFDDLQITRDDLIQEEIMKEKIELNNEQNSEQNSVSKISAINFELCQLKLSFKEANLYNWVTAIAVVQRDEVVLNELFSGEYSLQIKEELKDALKNKMIEVLFNDFVIFAQTV